MDLAIMMPELHKVEVVVLDLPLNQSFTYYWHQPLVEGTRVEVDFAGRVLVGIVWAFNNDKVWTGQIKVLRQVFESEDPIPLDVIRQVCFVSKYYHAPIGQVMFTALPSKVRQAKALSWERKIQWSFSATGLHAPAPKGAKQQLLWQAFIQKNLSLIEARKIHAQAALLIEKWHQEGYLQESLPAGYVQGESLLLNTEQQCAVDAVVSALDKFSPFLLQGITGSGKTEVYLQVIDKVLAKGLQVLVLIPEINLTPQLLDRFTQRFVNSTLVSLHSSLNDQERFDHWMQAKNGIADIVIGTRLAVFASLPRVGLIVVDEEHDMSFKQQDGVRYHARDVAVWRASQCKIPIVLGSATPSSQSVKNALAGKYQRLRLNNRAKQDASLPQIDLIDTRQIKLKEGFSPTALEMIRQSLEKKEQCLVFINRRGYSPVLACPQCAWTSKCTHCSAQMVVHLQERLLKCHHCGDKHAITRACPDCGNLDILPLGEGTQRLTQALEQYFPEARLLRIDRDTTYGKHAWDDIYRQVNAGEVDILIGTQMLAKGHDFSKLNLVLILNCDGSLYSADYRASERLFSLLMQVSGRAGRAQNQGRVLLQTAWPDHPVYQALIRHDFDGFMSDLIEERAMLGLPPEGFQALLRADAASLSDAEVFLNAIKEVLPLSEDVMVWGPANALMAKLAGRERSQLVFESMNRNLLHQYLNMVSQHLESKALQKSNIHWSLDIDPYEF